MDLDSIEMTEEKLQELITNAEAGDAEAQYDLGAAYLKGKGVAEDKETAVFWFRKAAEQGYAAAQYVIGSTYCNDYKDNEQAIFWLTKAAEQGYMNAQFNLGTIYYNINDTEHGRFWWEKAAEQGHEMTYWD